MVSSGRMRAVNIQINQLGRTIFDNGILLYTGIYMYIITL